MKLRPVVLSGGSGTRLWPLSREFYPKQLLAPLGGSTLLQATLERLAGLESELEIQPPIVVCSEEHRFLVAEQLRVQHEPATLILEPVGRNTAPAATLAALQALVDSGAQTPLLIMPADHLIADNDAFHRAVSAGATLAADGFVVTFGIVPTRPETGYGYIRKGHALGNSVTPVSFVDRFVEKPDAATAEAWFASGEYLWNSGIFIVTPAVWLSAVERLRPDMLAAVRRAWEQGTRDGDFFRAERAAFSACPSDSIDYAVMEPLTATTEEGAPRAAVIPLDAGWSDLGAWSSLWEALPRDADGNALRGDVAVHDSRNSLLLAEHRLVAGIGLDDIIVVETADAVLVVHKNHAEDVKRLVARLKAEGRSEHQLHRRVQRPWGNYEGIDHGARFQVKRITVKPGASLSLQMHHHRAEHWVVVSGAAQVVRGDETFLLRENESTYIPAGVRHRLVNPGTIALEIIEIQSGSYLGEDDIVRFEDHYGRA
ncbi:MAG: mannose-1-phosphate guanylyltransferase/mannose-6-phosphate isomerase [Chromatiales bacterium]|jgi:mannose-1-phosphate guanylyltransferase/mannose-6-phosphate isomerase|nr:mannose-1-phosphate guanylyltransferase/mannose-6-phosphate isomerase [Chromatiales bacterium]